MSNLKVIEEGRRAREIWAKRLGFQIRTLPLNPDGTRPKPKAEEAKTVKAEVAETVKAKAETVEATEAKPAVESAAKPVTKPAAKPAAKPEVKATPTNVGVPAAK